MSNIAYVRLAKKQPEYDKPVYVEFLESARTVLRYVGDLQSFGFLGSRVSLEDVLECCDRIGGLLSSCRNKCAARQDDDDAYLFEAIEYALYSPLKTGRMAAMRVKRDIMAIQKDPAAIMDCIDRGFAKPGLLHFLARAEKYMKHTAYPRLRALK